LTLQFLDFVREIGSFGPLPGDDDVIQM